MSRLDFHFEFHSKVSQPTDALSAEAESRLLELATGRKDLVGAAVTVEELTGEETPHFYRARVVLYIRPEEIAAVEKADTIERALRAALEAAERQVHQRREKLAKRWQQPDNLIQMDNIYDLTAGELYDAYAQQRSPNELLDLGRTAIASKLMVDRGLDEEAAYYAADQILVIAEEMIETDQSVPPEVT